MNQVKFDYFLIMTKLLLLYQDTHMKEDLPVEQILLLNLPMIKGLAENKFILEHFSH